MDDLFRVVLEGWEEATKEKWERSPRWRASMRGSPGMLEKLRQWTMEREMMNDVVRSARLRLCRPLGVMPKILDFAQNMRVSEGLRMVL